MLADEVRKTDPINLELLLLFSTYLCTFLPWLAFLEFQTHDQHANSTHPCLPETDQTAAVVPLLPYLSNTPRQERANSCAPEIVVPLGRCLFVFFSIIRGLGQAAGQAKVPSVSGDIGFGVSSSWSCCDGQSLEV